MDYYSLHFATRVDKVLRYSIAALTVTRRCPQAASLAGPSSAATTAGNSTARVHAKQYPVCAASPTTPHAVFPLLLAATHGADATDAHRHGSLRHGGCKSPDSARNLANGFQAGGDADFEARHRDTETPNRTGEALRSRRLCIDRNRRPRAPHQEASSRSLER